MQNVPLLDMDAKIKLNVRIYTTLNIPVQLGTCFHKCCMQKALIYYFMRSLCWKASVVSQFKHVNAEES